MRIFILGPRGSGKTTVGREMATKLGVFHIAFPEYLQEQIMPKMKKPPLVDEDEWEPMEGTCCIFCVRKNRDTINFLLLLHLCNLVTCAIH